MVKCLLCGAENDKRCGCWRDRLPGVLFSIETDEWIHTITTEEWVR